MRWRRTAAVSSRTFEAGEVIFRQGDAATREAYLVREGRVEVSRRLDGQERILRTLGAGDLLGEVALFRDAPHSATAVAAEHAVLLVIPSDRLESLVGANPRLAIALIRQLARMAGRDDSGAPPPHDEAVATRGQGGRS
jgi:CRP-like cAMP-binding protein